MCGDIMAGRAVLDDAERRQLLDILLEQCRHLEHQVAALVAGHRAPGGKGGARGVNSQIDIVGTAETDFRR